MHEHASGHIGCFNPSGSLDFWISDMTYEYYLRVIRGAVSAAWDFGISLVLYSGGPQRCEETLDRIAGSENLKGVIILGDWFNQGVLRKISAWGIPAAAVGCSVSDRISSVSQDHRLGGYLAAEHLIKRGHGRIAYIGQADDPVSDSGRFAGYLDALKHHGIAADPRLWVSAPFAEGGGRRAMNKLLARERDFSAAVFFSDNLFYECFEVMSSMGLRVPEDIGAVGFDDTLRSICSSPALTTVHSPLEEMGRRAVEIVTEQNPCAALQVQHEVLPVYLVQRET